MPFDFLFALDCSRSMKSSFRSLDRRKSRFSRIELAARGLAALLDTPQQFRSLDRVGILCHHTTLIGNSRIENITPLGPPDIPLQPHSRVIGRLLELEGSGGCDLAFLLSQVIEAVVKQEIEYAKRMTNLVVFTDSKNIDDRRIREFIPSLVNKGIIVDIVALAPEEEIYRLAPLATETKGSLVYVPTPELLVDLLAKLCKQKYVVEAEEELIARSKSHIYRIEGLRRKLQAALPGGGAEPEKLLQERSQLEHDRAEVDRATFEFTQKLDQTIKGMYQTLAGLQTDLAAVRVSGEPPASRNAKVLTIQADMDSLARRIKALERALEDLWETAKPPEKTEA